MPDLLISSLSVYEVPAYNLLGHFYPAVLDAMITSMSTQTPSYLYSLDCEIPWRCPFAFCNI